MTLSSTIITVIVGICMPIAVLRKSKTQINIQNLCRWTKVLE